MNSLWWLALPTLLLPVWWHRKKRVQAKAAPLASARFLPRTEPKQRRVWRWADLLLLVVRCLLLACTVAWLADPVFPWRGDSVILVPGLDGAWAEREGRAAGFGDAQRVTLPAEQALAWIGAHEREFTPQARVLVLGALPMPALLPRFARPVLVRSPQPPAAGAGAGAGAAAALAPAVARVAIVSERAPAWRRLFAGIDGPLRVVFDPAPGPRTDLIIWDQPDAPPAALRAPLWWVTDAGAWTELARSTPYANMRYADGARGRLWVSQAWPPQDAAAARALVESWRALHYPPVPHVLPTQAFGASAGAAHADASGALRAWLLLALVILFVLERLLAHARR
jgi:hypothetical protein